MTYESGCAPWICANYAQLPKKPEVDTLKKIVFIGEFDAQGNRLLGTFTNEEQDVKPEEGIFNKDGGLKGRIIRGDYAAPMIRILYEHLDPNFNAEDDFPKVLRELREQWPTAVPGSVKTFSLEPEVQVQLVDALSTLLEKTDDELQWVLRREIYEQISKHDQELWLKMERIPWKKGTLFEKVRAAKLSLHTNPHPANPTAPHLTPLHPAFQAHAAIKSALETLEIFPYTDHTNGTKIDHREPPYKKGFQSNDWVAFGVKFRPRGEGAASSSSGGLLDADMEGAAVLQLLM